MSLPGQVFELLAGAPDRSWTRQQLAERLDANVGDVSRALWQLTEATERPGGHRRGVRRVGRNRYQFLPHVETPTGGWRITATGADVLVVVDPSGRMWIARPADKDVTL